MDGVQGSCLIPGRPDANLGERQTSRLAVFLVDFRVFPGKNTAVSSFDDCELSMSRLHADILDMMSWALASASFLRGETRSAAATAFKRTTKTTKTTA